MKLDLAGSVRLADQAGVKWLIRTRGALVILLTSVAVYWGFRGVVQRTWPPLAVTSVMGIYNLACAILIRRRKRLDGLVFASLILDLVALTCYLHYSGDVENPFFFFYVFPVVAGAVLLRQKIGFILAGCAALLSLGMATCTLYAMMPIHLKHHHLALLHDYPLHKWIDPDETTQGTDYLVTNGVVFAALLFGSAFGFGTLAERNRLKEARLEFQNSQMTSLLQILPEGVVLLDRKGSILIANPAARNFLGALDGANVQALDPSLDLAKRLEEFKGPVEEFETVHDERVMGHALARGGDHEQLVWVFRDLTESRRLVARMMHQSKMADLGLLAAGIAHEIGNPLSSMSAILQLMELKESAPELADRFQSLHANLDRIHRIVQDIGGFAKPSAEKRARVRVSALIDGATRIFRFHEKFKGIQLDVVSEGPPVEVEVVEDQIVQVLLNLLLNAADACRGRGTIQVKSSAKADESDIAVVDQGTGISEEQQEHLFVPFFTTKDQGKGLGLFISESIVRAHNGRIEVDSAPGRGSSFTVRLPRTPEAA